MPLEWTWRLLSTGRVARSTLGGVTHCPETLCAPCKLLFGNHLEAAERGEDTYDCCAGVVAAVVGRLREQSVAQSCSVAIMITRGGCLRYCHPRR